MDMDVPDSSAVPVRKDGRPDVEMVSMIDPMQRETDYKYDALGNVIEQTTFAPTSQLSTFKQVTDSNSNAVGFVRVFFTYDPLFSKMTSETDAEGHTTYYVYDDTAYSLADSTGGPAPPMPPLKGGVTLPAATGLTGNLLATIDAVGDVTQYQYFTGSSQYNVGAGYGPGDLMQEIDPKGYVTLYENYDAYGNAGKIFAQTTGMQGITTTQTFDSRSRMTSQEDTFKHHVDDVYDGLDRVVREVHLDDQNDQAYGFSLPEDGQYPLPGADAGKPWAEETITQYYPGGQVSETINGLDQQTLYVYDDANRLMTQTEPGVIQADGSTTTVVTAYKYDEDDNKTDEYDLRDGPGTMPINVQNTSDPIHFQYKFDKLNRLIETDVIDNPSNPAVEPTMKAAYDLVGNKLWQIDLHQNRTIYAYDWLYRVVDVTLPLTGQSLMVPPVLHTTYDRAGNILVQTDANNNPTTSTYDAANRLLTEIDPVGNEIDYVYDFNGNVILETHKSPLVETSPRIPNAATHVTYIVAHPADKIDGMDRPTEMDETVYLGDPTDPNVKTVIYETTYQYLDPTNTVITTDPRGNAHDPKDPVSGQTETQLDGLDRVHSTIVDFSAPGPGPAGLNLTTSYTYDQDGNQATITDPAGTVVANTYDGLDRMIMSKDELNPAEQFFYDGNGNVVEHVDKRGIVFTTTYDNLDRVLTQNVREDISNNGTVLPLLSKEYHDSINEVIATDADGHSTSTTYDALGRPLVVTDPYNNTVVSTYDGVNLKTQIDQNRNETTFLYDADNRSIEVDEDGTTGSAITTTYEEYRDAQNQIIDVGPRKIGIELISTIHQNDSLGRLISLSVQNGSLALEYGTDEVTLERNNYDGDGNVTVATDALGNLTNSVYDGADRLLSMTEGANDLGVAGTTHYTYDKVGDLVSVQGPRVHGAPTQAFPTDAEPPPVGYFDTYYTYDILHRKLTETDGAGDTTHYVYDANDNIITMIDPKGFTTAYAYDELDAILSVDETQRHGGITYYRYDGNRNKIAQQDADGNLVTYEYDALNRLTDTFQYLTPGPFTSISPRPLLTSLYSNNPAATQAIHWQFAFDANGNETQILDPKSQITIMTYDYRNRLATVTYTNAADAGLAYQPLMIMYSYDADDNQIKSVETKTGPGGGAISEQYLNAYDALGHLTQTTRDDNLGASDDTTNEIGYTYDRQGNLKSETVPGATSYYQQCRRRQARSQRPMAMTLGTV